MAGGKKGATSNINNRTGNTLPTVPEEDPLVGQEEGGSGSPPSLGNNGLEALWAKIQELEKGRVEQDRLMAELMEENERLRGAHPSKRAKSAHERVVVDDSADNREDEGEGSKSNRPHELTAENGRGGSVLKGFNTLTPAELAIEASLNVRRSPFSPRIMSMTRPRKFRAPKFILYDGSSDPLDHIYHFQQKMDADQYDEDYLLCRTFASSLGSEAMSWFRALPEGSVDSFRELCRLFVSQYVCNVRKKKDVNELFALRQYQGERMKDFVKRFSALHGQVEGCDTKVAALAFRAGLLKGSKLELSLYKKPPTDLTEVMARADAVIRVEEHSNPPPKLASAMNTSSGSQQRRGSEQKRNESRKATEGKTFRLSSCTVNTHPITIWAENKGLFRAPNPIVQDISMRDRSKRCDFHNDVGHSNEECKSLRNQISVMVEKGLLKKYVVQRHEKAVEGQRRPYVPNNQRLPQGQSNRQVQQRSFPEHPARVINMVRIGASKKMSRSDWQKEGKKMKLLEQNSSAQVLKVEKVQDIVFTDGDLDGVNLPHGDPLVIELMVANCLVRRIFVDPGSDTDLMFYSTYKEFGFSDDMMGPVASPLISFSNQEVKPVGMMTLPVSVQGVTLQTDFTIVDCFSTFNMIMGRSWIHAMRGVPSTWHQKMKCLTPWGVITINGNQREAKRCNMLSKATKGKEKADRPRVGPGADPSA